MKQIQDYLNGLAYGLGCILVVIGMLIIKPLLIMLIIWILHNWCDFTLIPILTFWQAFFIGLLFAILVTGSSINTTKKTN